MLRVCYKCGRWEYRCKGGAECLEREKKAKTHLWNIVDIGVSMSFYCWECKRCGVKGGGTIEGGPSANNTCREEQMRRAID